jgi:hypothetical protein
LLPFMVLKRELLQQIEVLIQYVIKQFQNEFSYPYLSLYLAKKEQS